MCSGSWPSSTTASALPPCRVRASPHPTGPVSFPPSPPVTPLCHSAQPRAPLGHRQAAVPCHRHQQCQAETSRDPGVSANVSGAQHPPALPLAPTTPRPHTLTPLVGGCQPLLPALACRVPSQSQPCPQHHPHPMSPCSHPCPHPYPHVHSHLISSPSSSQSLFLSDPCSRAQPHCHHIPIPQPQPWTSPSPSPALPAACAGLRGAGAQAGCRQGAGRVQADCGTPAGPSRPQGALAAGPLRQPPLQAAGCHGGGGCPGTTPPPTPAGPWGGWDKSPWACSPWWGWGHNAGPGAGMVGLGLAERGLPAPLPVPCLPTLPPPPQCTFAPGHVIIHEGDEGENFYIILKGEVGTTPRSTGEPPPMVRGRALPCVPHPIPPSPLSPFPCPGAAGAGEPAGGWAGEAAPCPGHRRALWGALPAAVGAPAAVPPPWQHLRCHPGLATWLRCHWLAWACCGQRAGPCGGGVVLAVAPHTPAQPRRPQHLQRRVGMAVVCSPASAHTHASLARAHMEL